MFSAFPDRLIASAALTALALACSGCGAKGPVLRAGGPDAVVLIIIDTLRADYLGSYGYADSTSPTLDRLAAEGLRFEDVTTVAPVTLPSVTSILTGQIPPRHGVRDNAGFVLAEAEETLAERFRAAGWRTGAVVSSAVLSADRGIDQGFEFYRDEFGGDYPIYAASLEPMREEIASDRRRADRSTDLALELIEEFGHQPYFLMVHYFDVHAHYDPPPEHGRLFPRNPYAGEIHFVDAEIERLLRAARSGHDPLIVVVADHGEGLGEHGEVGHGFLLHQATLRVPLIVAGPQVPKGRVRRDPVSTVDLERSIAASSGLVPSDRRRDGRLLLWAGPEETNPPAFYAETMRTLFSYQWSHLRALRQAGFKLVEGPYDEFFDLRDDPRELKPLDLDLPIAVQLKAALRALVSDDDPERLLEQIDEPDPERLETLQSLGYVGDVTEPAEAAHSREEYWRPHPAQQIGKWTERQHNRSRYRRAAAMLERGEFDGALATLDTFLQFEPRHGEAIFNRAVALWTTGRRNEARVSLRECLEIDPDYLPALKIFAQDLAQRKEPERALPMLESWVRQEPDNAEALYNLGACALMLDRYELGRQSLRRFLEVAPDDERAASVRQSLAEMN